MKNCLARRGVIDDDICPICRRDPKTVLHALRNCSQVKAFWIQLGVKLTNQGFWLTNLQDWLNFNPRLAADIIHQTMKFMYCVSSPRGPTRNIVKRVWWERPPGGWSKLNVDGIALGNLGLVGCGGIVRDDHGGWLAGFSRCIGITTSCGALGTS